MVDALVAVVVASLMIAVCLASLNLSRRMTTGAQDTRQAHLTLQTLIETTPAKAGHSEGRRDGMAYIVDVKSHKDHDVLLCELDLSVSKGKHRWLLQGTRWCVKDVPV